jgi:CRISPR-associated protein Cas6
MPTHPPKRVGYNIPLSPGVYLPKDNGFIILSALSRKFPWVHGNPDIQIAPIRGTRIGNPQHIRTDRHSVLHIRGITEEQARLLSGTWLVVEGGVLGLEDARECSLPPCSYLVSRLVVLPDAVEEDAFREALAQRLPSGTEIRLGRRHAIKLKGRTFIGYAVHLLGLSQDVSWDIQGSGIGKYTSMGCGVFYPGASGSAVS